MGARDDFVSPHDQVDLDVEGIRAWAPSGHDSGGAHSSKKTKNFFVLEMPGADHTGVLNFHDELGPTKQAIFLTALTSAPEELEALSDPNSADPFAEFVINPADLWDAPPVVDTDVTDLVFVLHGIRDDGFWTHRIAAAVKKTWEAKWSLANPNPTPGERPRLFSFLDPLIWIFSDGGLCSPVDTGDEGAVVYGPLRQCEGPLSECNAALCRAFERHLRRCGRAQGLSGGPFREHLFRWQCRRSGLSLDPDKGRGAHRNDSTMPAERPIGSSRSCRRASNT